MNARVLGKYAAAAPNLPPPPPCLLINYFTQTPSCGFKPNNVIKPGTIADNLLTAGHAKTEVSGAHKARHLEPVVVGGPVARQGVGSGGSVGVNGGLLVCGCRLFVGRSWLFVGWGRGVVAGGWLSVFLGGGAVAVDSRGTVFGLVS